MRARQIIEAREVPRVSASPLTHLLTNRILSEWEIARDAVLFDEEAVDLARVIQTVLDEQKNAVSLLTGAKNEEMTPWWAGMAIIWGAIGAGGLIAGILWVVLR